jgi:hypothetical protein
MKIQQHRELVQHVLGTRLQSQNRKLKSRNVDDDKIIIRVRKKETKAYLANIEN